MSKSDYLEAQLLNGVLGGGTWSKPGTVHVSLHSTATTDAGGGTELSGGGYARVAVTNNATNFPNATGTSPTSKSNGTEIAFPTATGNWSTASHFAIWDAATSGNMLYHGALTASKTVQTGDTARFAAGALVITED
jgi:hypothetical protein